MLKISAVKNERDFVTRGFTDLLLVSACDRRRRKAGDPRRTHFTFPLQADFVIERSSEISRFTHQAGAILLKR